MSVIAFSDGFGNKKANKFGIELSSGRQTFNNSLISKATNVLLMEVS